MLVGPVEASLVKEPSPLKPSERTMIEDIPAMMDAMKRAQQLLGEYEATRNPAQLEEMKSLKPLCHLAAESLARGMRRCDSVVQVQELRQPLKEFVGLHVAQHYLALGGLCLYTGSYSEAWDAYDAARQVAEDINNIHELVQALNNLGWVALVQGDFDIAIEQLQSAADYLDRLSMSAPIRRNVLSNLDHAKRRTRPRHA